MKQKLKTCEEKNKQFSNTWRPEIPLSITGQPNRINGNREHNKPIRPNRNIQTFYKTVAESHLLKCTWDSLQNGQFVKPQTGLNGYKKMPHKYLFQPMRMKSQLQGKLNFTKF